MLLDSFGITIEEAQLKMLLDSFGIAIEEAQLKMLLVKVLAKNIDMELPITLEEFSSHTINTFSRGYHEYMSVWMPQIGDDSLFCRRELSNEYNEYAVAIVAIDHFKREEGSLTCASFSK